MNACVPMAGLCVFAYLMLLAGMILKGLNHYPRLTRQVLSRTYSIHTHTHTVHIHTYTHCLSSYIRSFALSDESAMAIWPNE